MGTTQSKLRKHLINGDEYAVLEMLHNYPELGVSFNPNSDIGDQDHNSALHITARYAMKPLIRLFLYDLGANPNVLNAKKQSSLHLVCKSHTLVEHSLASRFEFIASCTSLPTTSLPCAAVQERRAMCLAMLLQWQRDPLLEMATNGVHQLDLDSAVKINAVDINGETALHMAAASGLMKCVELLVEFECPLFVENKDGDTACDVAAKHHFDQICEFLELKMVFYSRKRDHGRKSTTVDLAVEPSRGLSQQDLQEAKSQLLAETSDMLHVTAGTAEALLRAHEWSREQLLDEWIRDKAACCANAGVNLPETRVSSATSMAMASDRKQSKKGRASNRGQVAKQKSHDSDKVRDTSCEICCLQVDEMYKIACGHKFCHDCWKQYLEQKISAGDTHNVFCPAFECMHMVPMDLIEKVVSPELVQRFVVFNLNAFVETNPTIKWCPKPGCTKAVHLSEGDTRVKKRFEALFSLPAISIAVDCGQNHYFCWDCLGEAHAPCKCGLVNY